MSDYIELKPMPVHAIICTCGNVIIFPSTWEYVLCTQCKTGYNKNQNGNYVASGQ